MFSLDAQGCFVVSSPYVVTIHPTRPRLFILYTGATDSQEPLRGRRGSLCNTVILNIASPRDCRNLSHTLTPLLLSLSNPKSRWKARGTNLRWTGYPSGNTLSRRRSRLDLVHPWHSAYTSWLTRVLTDWLQCSELCQNSVRGHDSEAQQYTLIKEAFISRTNSSRRTSSTLPCQVLVGQCWWNGGIYPFELTSLKKRIIWTQSHRQADLKIKRLNYRTKKCFSNLTISSIWCTFSDTLDTSVLKNHGHMYVKRHTHRY